MTEEAKTTALTQTATPVALTTVPDLPPALAKIMSEEKYIAVLTGGDYSGLGLQEQAAFLFMHSNKRGLDPWRRPYQFIKQENRLILYAGKEAARQYRHRDGLTTKITYKGALRLQYEGKVLKQRDGSEEVVLVPTLFDPSVYEVEVDVVNRDGDVVETEVGTSELGGLTGRDRKDTVMKAITRAKNRGLLAAAGESSNDESEYDAPRSPRAVERPDTPARRLPVPEPNTIPPVPSQTLSTAAGTIVDVRTGEDLTPAPTNGPRPAGPLPPTVLGASTGGTPLPLPRKMPPSTPPMVQRSK